MERFIDSGRRNKRRQADGIEEDDAMEGAAAWC